MLMPVLPPAPVLLLFHVLLHLRLLFLLVLGGLDIELERVLVDEAEPCFGDPVKVVDGQVAGAVAVGVVVVDGVGEVESDRAPVHRRFSAVGAMKDPKHRKLVASDLTVVVLVVVGEQLLEGRNGRSQ